MGNLNDIRTQVDDSMMLDLDRLAGSMGSTPEALFHEALTRLIEDAAETRAFIQEGINFAENEPMTDQDKMESWFAERVRARSAA